MAAHVKVEVNVSEYHGDPGPFHVFRASLSRVPAVDEIVRVLTTIDGVTGVRWFRIARVVHDAATDEYPRREDAVEAWVDCHPASKEW